MNSFLYRQTKSNWIYYAFWIKTTHNKINCSNQLLESLLKIIYFFKLGNDNCSMKNVHKWKKTKRSTILIPNAQHVVNILKLHSICIDRMPKLVHDIAFVKTRNIDSVGECVCVLCKLRPHYLVHLFNTFLSLFALIAFCPSS